MFKNHRKPSMVIALVAIAVCVACLAGRFWPSGPADASVAAPPVSVAPANSLAPAITQEYYKKNWFSFGQPVASEGIVVSLVRARAWGHYHTFYPNKRHAAAARAEVAQYFPKFWKPQHLKSWTSVYDGRVNVYTRTNAQSVADNVGLASVKLDELGRRMYLRFTGHPSVQQLATLAEAIEGSPGLIRAYSGDTFRLQTSSRQPIKALVFVGT